MAFELQGREAEQVADDETDERGDGQHGARTSGEQPATWREGRRPAPKRKFLRDNALRVYGIKA